MIRDSGKTSTQVCYINGCDDCIVQCVLVPERDHDTHMYSPTIRALDSMEGGVPFRRFSLTDMQRDNCVGEKFKNLGFHWDPKPQQKGNNDHRPYPNGTERPTTPPSLEIWSHGRDWVGGDKALTTGFHSFKILFFFSSSYMDVGGSNTRERVSIGLCVGYPPSPFHGPSSHKTIWRRRCRSTTTRVTTRGGQEGGGERRGGEGDSCFDEARTCLSFFLSTLSLKNLIWCGGKKVTPLQNSEHEIQDGRTFGLVGPKKRGR